MLANHVVFDIFGLLCLLALLWPISLNKMQSEDDLSLSGIPLTALFFNLNSRLLVSGDQSGTVSTIFDSFGEL